MTFSILKFSKAFKKPEGHWNTGWLRLSRCLQVISHDTPTAHCFTIAALWVKMTKHRRVKWLWLNPGSIWLQNWGGPRSCPPFSPPPVFYPVSNTSWKSFTAQRQTANTFSPDTVQQRGV